ncbi:microtubule-associated protein 9 isoform 5-T8 [Sarcophilus harrisii]
MSDDLYSTILAYTKSPKITKRTTFQDELQKAVSARTARQQSEDYSDDFDSDDVGSLGGFSDTSVDEKSATKNLTNDFYVSDDEEKSSPKVSFLKTKTTNSSVTKDLLTFPTKTEKEARPDTLDEFGMILSKFHGRDQEIEQEETRTRSTPRLVKFVSSENISNLEKDTNAKPLPRLRGILRKSNHVGDKDVLEEEDVSAFSKTQFSHSAPSSLMRLGGKMLEIEQRTLSESPNSEGPWLTSPRTSLSIPHQLPETENLGDYLFPSSAERSSKNDPEETIDENHNVMKSEDSDDTFSPSEELMVSTLEKAAENQETIDELEENMKKLQLFVDEDRKSSSSNTSLKDWLIKKNLCFQELQRIKKNEAENLKIQNEQKGAKREASSASFEAWKAMKEKEAKKVAAKKKIEEKKMRKIEEENAEKKGEAQRAFEKWKEKKLEYLKEKNKKEREYERAKKKKEEEYYAEKIKDNLSAVERWHEQKDYLIRQKMKEKINERRRQEIRRIEKEDKDKLAVSEYERWLDSRKMPCSYAHISKPKSFMIAKQDYPITTRNYEKEKKERKQKHERKQKKHHVLYSSESFPRWSSPRKLAPSKHY